MDKGNRPGLAWLWFSLLRIGIFAVVLTVLLLVLPVPQWVSALLAALIAFCISFIFLNRPRAELAGQLERARRGEANLDTRDDDAEDAAVDSPDSRG